MLEGVKMDRKIALFCLGLLLASALSHAQQAQVCATAVNPTYLDVTQDPVNHKVTAFAYNKSARYEKFGIAKAAIIRVNMSDPAQTPKLCYQLAGATGDMFGSADFAYDPELDGCLDYWFIYCPLGATSFAFETCLNGTGLDTASPVPRCTEYDDVSGEAAKEPTHLLSHNEVYFCNQKPKNYAALCWPLLLIAGLLIGGSFALGRNPFEAFDFSSPRMNRGRQYTMKVQQRSFDALTYAYASGTLAETAGKVGSAIGGRKDVIVNGQVMGEVDPKTGNVVDKNGNVVGRYENGTFTPGSTKNGRFVASGDPVKATTGVHNPGWGRFGITGLIQMGTMGLASGVAGLFRPSDKIEIGGRSYEVKNGIAYDDEGKAVGFVNVDGQGNRYLVAAMGMRMIPMAIDGKAQAGGFGLAGTLGTGTGSDDTKVTKQQAAGDTRTIAVTKETMSGAGAVLSAPDPRSAFNNLDKMGMTDNDRKVLENDGIFSFLYQKVLANSGLSEAKNVLDYIWATYSMLTFMSGYARGLGKGIGFVDKLNQMKLGGLNIVTIAGAFDPYFGGQFGATTETQLISPFATLMKSLYKDASVSLTGELNRPEQQFMRGVRNGDLGITLVINGNDFIARTDDRKMSDGTVTKGIVISDKAELLKYLKDHGASDNLLSYVENGRGGGRPGATVMERLGRFGFDQPAWFSMDGEGNLAEISQKAYGKGIDQWKDHLKAELSLVMQVMAGREAAGAQEDRLLSADATAIQKQLSLLEAMSESGGADAASMQQIMMMQMQYRMYEEARQQVEKAKYIENEYEREGSQLHGMRATTNDNERYALEYMVSGQQALGIATITAAETVSSVYSAGLGMDNAVEALNRYNAAIKSTDATEVKNAYEVLGGKEADLAGLAGDEAKLAKMKLDVINSYSEQMSQMSSILGRADMLAVRAPKSEEATMAEKVKALKTNVEEMLANAGSSSAKDVHEFNGQLALAVVSLMQEHDYSGAVLNNSNEAMHGMRNDFKEELEERLRKIADESSELSKSDSADGKKAGDNTRMLEELVRIESVLYRTSEQYIDGAARGNPAVFAPSYLGASDQRYLEGTDIYNRVHFGQMNLLPGKNRDSEHLYGDVILHLPDEGKEPINILNLGHTPEKVAPSELPRAELKDYPPVEVVDKSSKDRAFIPSTRDEKFSSNVENVTDAAAQHWKEHEEYYKKSGEKMVVVVNFPVEDPKQHDLNDRMEQETIAQVKQRLAEAGVPIERISFLTGEKETLEMGDVAGDKDNWKSLQKNMASGNAFGEDGQKLSKLIDSDDMKAIKSAKTYEQFQSAVRDADYDGTVYLPKERGAYDPLRTNYIGPASQFDVVAGKGVLKEKKG